jgi:hypothetical protein
MRQGEFLANLNIASELIIWVQYRNMNVCEIKEIWVRSYNRESPKDKRCYGCVNFNGWFTEKCYDVCVMILKDQVKFNNKIVSRIKLRSLNIIENIQITNNTLYNIETSLETINSQLW